ncbi:hypothetical protein GYMLUDRAFT_240358 [Collybiopsis luxurians FD-317 M1]|nr:hypothetical protein GYMLUDRAFT_240358 [Collybiopsis luxurians FD-317 M1]
MLALSPACDLFASSSATSTTKALYQLPSLFGSSLSDLSLSFTTPSSFSTSPRQQAFVESPAQRRARIAFVQKQNRGEEEEKRVENWVREQAQQSAFMIAAAKVSAEKAKVNKGHHKRSTSLQLQLRPEVLPRKGITDELMLGRMLKDSSNLPSITEDEEEEEPYIFYSTPLPQYSTTTTTTATTTSVYYNSNTSQRSPTRPSHQRRLSDLEVIPEGLEE